MKCRWFAPLLAASVLISHAQEWTVANLAGTGTPRAADEADGTKAINDPYGLVRGPDGALWFCEHNQRAPSGPDRKSTRLNSSH